MPSGLGNWHAGLQMLSPDDFPFHNPGRALRMLLQCFLSAVIQRTGDFAEAVQVVPRLWGTKSRQQNPAGEKMTLNLDYF